MQVKQGINRSMTGLGLLLVLGGLLAPALIGVKEFGIFSLMERSLMHSSSGILLMASFKLVMLNTVRALPLYIGVLLIAEGMGLFQAGSPRYLLVIPVFIIPAIYEVIRMVYGIAYDFGTPAISLILAIIIMNRMHHMARHIIHKILVFALLLFGVEWLDIVPDLTRYWFGRGEISLDIKRIAVFMDVEDILNITGVSLFVICVTNSFIMAGLLSTYTRRINTAEQAKVDSQLKMQRLENRSLREMQSLVHDLKTPLTSIQGLAGVLAISEIGETQKGYALRIIEAGDKMNTMISELLQDDKRQIVSAADLVEYASACLPELAAVGNYHILTEGRPSYINVNKTKMSRAIINLLENSLEAVNGKQGCIDVAIRRKNGHVLIEIKDNGKGISAEDQRYIWEVGFSTKNSSGLGLPFVKEIIERNEGNITIDSKPGLGTRATIELPEVCL